MGTKDQCADSLTKFLRGGPDQIKAREHLSSVSLENCTMGEEHTLRPVACATVFGRPESSGRGFAG